VTSVEDAECSECPLTSSTDKNVDGLKETVLENGRITIIGVANVLGILFQLVQNNPKVCQTVTKFVPCLLNEEQKENYVNMCQDLRQKLQRDLGFLSELITGDETP
jgi:hypothetical protein